MNAHDLQFWISAPPWAQLAYADHELLVESTTPEWAKPDVAAAQVHTKLGGPAGNKEKTDDAAIHGVQPLNPQPYQYLRTCQLNTCQLLSFSADKTATLPPGSVVRESHYDPETRRVVLLVEERRA